MILSKSIIRRTSRIKINDYNSWNSRFINRKTTAEANALHAQEKPFDKKLLEAMQELEIAQQMLDDLTIKRNENNEK